jgi:cytosine/adenosine deaminase-related metal-dependent hydrolase
MPLCRSLVLLVALVGGCGPSQQTTDGGGPPPDLGGGPGIIPGFRDHILLGGTILTPDQVITGHVLIEADRITCVGDCAGEPGAVGATVIETHGIITPGLIDTHNHILFDVFDNDDWLPSQVYMNHDQWTAEPRYAAMLDVKQCLANDSQGKPTWCANTPYGTAAGSLRCEMEKFGELKALVAGTTSVVGLPGTSSGCFSSLTRSIDVAQNGLGTDKVQTSSTFPPSKATGDGVCANFASGTTNAFLVHCGEGVDAKSLAEFATLGSLTTTPNCLYAPQTTITHGTAFGATEFMTMAQKGMKLTWSPASNVALYGKTTDIPTALSAGVTVALAPDWSMGGSQNMLDELRFAAAWDDAHFGDRLSSQDLVQMVTANPAKVLALDDRLGRIQVGYIADLSVFAGDESKPYDAVLAASPKDVQLVLIGGVVLYGDAQFQVAGPPKPGCEALDVCGTPKFLCTALTDTTSKLDQTYADIKAALEQAMTDADAQTTTDGFSFAPLAPLVRCQ